jgi:hypothetical protein
MFENRVVALICYPLNTFCDQKIDNHIAAMTESPKLARR